MFKERILKIRGKYFQYALYFLIASLFLGSAILSIASVFFYILIIFIDIRKESFKAIVSNKAVLYPALFFLINFLIVCYYANNIKEILPIIKFLPFLVFPLIFYLYRDELNALPVKYDYKKIFIFFSIITFTASFVYSLYRVFFYEDTINTIYITYKFLTDLFGVHHIYLSVFYALALLFCLDFYIKQKKANKKYLFAACILFIAIILLSSRTAIVSTIIIAIIRMVINKDINKKSVLIILFLVLSSVSVTFVLPTLRNRIINFDENISSYSGLSFRVKVWKNAIELFKESPISGHSFVKSHNALQEQYLKANFRRAYLAEFNAHNQYLQTLIDSGVLGLFFLLLMILYPLYGFKMKIDFKLFVLLIMFSLTTESFLIRQQGIIFYCLFYGIFLNQIKKKIESGA